MLIGGGYKGVGATALLYRSAEGRRIYFAWVRERPPKDVVLAAGWSGVMSLPRVLTLRPDGQLGMEPLPELQTLRGHHTHVRGAEISDDEPA